jgi:hypothetical protein
MKKYKVINGIVISAVFIMLALVIVDYMNSKTIPNFIFLNEYGLEHVTAYWAGIGALIVLVPTIINLLLMRMAQISSEYNNRFLHEKDKLISIKRNLDRAIANLDFKNSDRKCISDIRDIVEAIDNQILEPQTSTQSISILAVEDLIIILAEYLHSLLRDKELCLRADARYLMRYLFSSNHIINYCEKNNNISIAEFENEYLYLKTLTKRNLYIFNNAKFTNVIFDSTESSYNGVLERFIFNESAIFNNCTIIGSDIVSLDNNAYLKFENCSFEETIKFVSEQNMVEHNSLIIKKSTFHQYTTLGYSKVKYIKIADCDFIGSTKLSYMYIRDVEIENSRFYGLFDMQFSKVNHVFRLINTCFDDVFLLWDTEFSSKYDVRIYGLKIKKQSSYMTNLRAKILDGNKEYLLNEYIQKLESTDDYTDYEFDSNMLNLRK